MKPFIINDGRDYYVIETINAETANKIQKSIQNGDNYGFNPIYRFTFLDKFNEK